MSNDSTDYMLGRMDGKLDMILGRLERQEQRHDRLEERVGALEAFRTKIVSYVSATSVAAVALFEGGRWLVETLLLKN